MSCTVNVRTVACLAAMLLVACIVDKAQPPAQTAVCPPAVACPSGSQCAAIEPKAPTGSVAAPAMSVAPKREPLTMRGTELRELHSDVNGKNYELIIGLPPSFEKEPNRRYPVLFILDAQWDFSLVFMLSGGLRYDEVAPEMLLVGLSYAGTNPDYESLRADDYTPTRAKDHHGVVLGGGAPLLLSWLESTVIPLVERDYRADPNHRMLSGASYGGLFTLYALTEKPDLFESYIALAPAVGWDQRLMFAREKALRKSHPKLEKHLWLSSGSDEWPDYLKDELDFFKQVQGSHYAGLTLKIYQAAGERHSGLKPESYNRAMRFVSEPLLQSLKSKGLFTAH